MPRTPDPEVGGSSTSHSGQTVVCPSARYIYSPKVLVIPMKWWLRPNMTEKVFTWTLKIKSTNHNIVVI